MKRTVNILASLLSVGILSVGLAAQTAGAGRYDSAIQTRASQQLAAKQQFHNVQASVDDGIVTLAGNVSLYQQKLDAAKKVRKLPNVQGVHNLIAVQGNASDSELEAKLDRKLYYDRTGYDNLFNFVTASVKDGVVTLNGDARTGYDRDSAFSLATIMPGVKDVVDNVSVAPTSNFDDSIRLRAARAIYRDPVLSRYASDPGKPIRIVVENGHLSLYGAVDSKMDKNIAGIRANQVFGVFSVQNNLEVVKGS
jgi:hyperosmotically inducible protein